MRHEIILALSAVRELGALRADVRGRVRDAIERHLDIEEDTVQVLAIVPKGQADAWLKAQGTPRKESGPRQGEG